MEPSFGYSKSACKRSGKLRGCVALITGADNGIGRAIAVAYAREALGRGVKVNGVTPYLAKKPLIPSTFPTGHVPHFGANTLFDRTAQPAELAPIFVLLAYQAVSFFTGEIYDMTRDQFRKSLTLSKNIARRFQTKL